MQPSPDGDAASPPLGGLPRSFLRSISQRFHTEMFGYIEGAVKSDVHHPIGVAKGSLGTRAPTPPYGGEKNGAALFTGVSCKCIPQAEQ